MYPNSLALYYYLRIVKRESLKLVSSGGVVRLLMGPQWVAGLGPHMWRGKA